LLAGNGGRADAAPITLTDRNSTVKIDPVLQDGMFLWSVDGVEQLHQQWFWFRKGNDPEASIDTLTFVGSVISNTDGRPGDDTLFLQYSGPGFVIGIQYSLVGGPTGSRVSDITEGIAIDNTGDQVLDFHFFQYTDLDLTNTPDDDTATLLNANTVGQTDPFTSITETVITPPPSHFEIAFVFATRDKLNDGVATTLSDTALTLGPGNVTWSFQWDASISPGGSFLISKDKNFFVLEPSRQIVVEPATLLLLGLGLLGAGMFGRLRSQGGKPSV
jgi:hypothetical protein